jgi:hypothetical protein
MLETTPVAVQLRMVETARDAMAGNNSNLVIAQSAGAEALMGMIGATSAMQSMVAR